MKRLVVLSFAVFCIPLLNFSQGLDSLKYFLNKEKPKFFFQFNNRGSFVQNRTAGVTAVLFGLSYSKRVKTGITGGLVTSKVYNDVVSKDGSLTKGLLQMWFAGVHFEYTYYKTAKLEISLPVSLNAGLSNYKYYYAGKTYYTDNMFGVTYEASTTVIYKPLFFVGIGGGLGYRLSYFPDKYLVRSFTSVIYNLEFKVYFGEIIKRFRKG